jgi:hypothetical protein
MRFLVALADIVLAGIGAIACVSLMAVVAVVARNDHNRTDWWE